MQKPSIDPATGVGTVHLAVTDAGRARAFYEGVLGLRTLDTGPPLRLGAGSRELVVLWPGAEAPVPRGTTGLYHLAIVVPSRAEFARSVRRVAERGWPHAPTDHTLTKSDYLWDPDGNGIEIYCETPEDGTWFMTDDGFGARDRAGRLRSGRDPISLPELYSALPGNPDLAGPLADGCRMGHVHLHVRDLAEAVGFYRDGIGFELMGRSTRLGMAFVAAGGYHHHVGLNTWAGIGAPPPPPRAAGLRQLTIEVPTGDALAAVLERLRRTGATPQRAGDAEMALTDPSGNSLRVRMRGAAPG